MENHSTLPHPPASAKVLALASQFVSVTGAMSVSRQQLKAVIRHAGASYHTSVGAGTTLLVVPHVPCDLKAKKVKDARRNGVRIVSEDELRGLILTAQSSPCMEQPPAKKVKMRHSVHEEVGSEAMDEGEAPVEVVDEEEKEATKEEKEEAAKEGNEEAAKEEAPAKAEEEKAEEVEDQETKEDVDRHEDEGEDGEPSAIGPAEWVVVEPGSNATPSVWGITSSRCVIA